MFNESIAIEKMVAAESGILMPVVEAPIEIIEHFNRGAMMQAFKKAKFFIYQGAIICQEGTREEVENELELSHKENPDEHMARLPQESMKQPIARFKRVTTPPA